MATENTIALVKAGQVGRALLDKLANETQGATDLLIAAKRSSECNPDLGPIPQYDPPLKTMQQTFMEEALKPEVKNAFDPLRQPQAGTQMRLRSQILTEDMKDETIVNGSLGRFYIKSGTLNQVTGMANVTGLTFTQAHEYYDGTRVFRYDETTGIYSIFSDGIINFAGHHNLMMLPLGYDINLTVDPAMSSESPVPYLNPTFLGTRGSNETAYRLSYHHFTTNQTATGVPDLYHVDTVFEGTFSHYDVAKVAEKRHAFNISLRCKAGDKLRFVMERGRSIVNFTGVEDVIRTVPYMVETSIQFGRTSLKTANQINAIFLTD